MNFARIRHQSSVGFPSIISLLPTLLYPSSPRLFLSTNPSYFTHLSSFSHIFVVGPRCFFPCPIYYFSPGGPQYRSFLVPSPWVRAAGLAPFFFGRNLLLSLTFSTPLNWVYLPLLLLEAQDSDCFFGPSSWVGLSGIESNLALHLLLR